MAWWCFWGSTSSGCRLSDCTWIAFLHDAIRLNGWPVPRQTETEGMDFYRHVIYMSKWLRLLSNDSGIVLYFNKIKKRILQKCISKEQTDCFFQTTSAPQPLSSIKNTLLRKLLCAVRMWKDRNHKGPQTTLLLHVTKYDTYQWCFDNVVNLCLWLCGSFLALTTDIPVLFSDVVIFIIYCCLINLHVTWYITAWCLLICVL